MARQGRNRDGSAKPLLVRQAAMSQSIFNMLKDLPDNKSRQAVIESTQYALRELAQLEARQTTIPTMEQSVTTNVSASVRHSEAAVQQPATPSQVDDPFAVG